MKRSFLAKTNRDTYAQFCIPSLCVCIPLSVLHSVVTHTTGVYQALAASHTHNALPQRNTEPRQIMVAVTVV